jgi:hypothetical protein
MNVQVELSKAQTEDEDLSRETSIEYATLRGGLGGRENESRAIPIWRTG